MFLVLWWLCGLVFLFVVLIVLIVRLRFCFVWFVISLCLFLLWLVFFLVVWWLWKVIVLKYVWRSYGGLCCRWIGLCGCLCRWLILGLCCCSIVCCLLILCWLDGIVIWVLLIVSRCLIIIILRDKWEGKVWYVIVFVCILICWFGSSLELWSWLMWVYRCVFVYVYI